MFRGVTARTAAIYSKKPIILAAAAGDAAVPESPTQLEIPSEAPVVVNEETAMLEVDEETVYDFQEFVPEMPEASDSEFGSKVGSLPEGFLAGAWVYPGEVIQHKVVQVDLAPSVKINEKKIEDEIEISLPESSRQS